MPNRIVRDGILTSEAVSSLSWAEEVLYRRLMSVADDHGRFHASPKLIRAACYPLLIDKVSDADIGKWLTSCVTAALVSVYPAQDGKRYLQISKFGQQMRSASKFPEPLAVASNCEQPPSVAHLGVVVVEGVVGARVTRSPPSECPSDVDPKVWADWLSLRKAKKAPVTGTVAAAAREEADKAGMTLEAFLKVWCARGSQGLQAEWLKPDERISKKADQWAGAA